MGTREDLHQQLVAILGRENVYFQPPESLKLEYPCIIYEIGGNQSPHADNRSWQRFWFYNVTYITRDVHEEIPLTHWDPFNFSIDSIRETVLNRLADLPYCSMGTPYVSDNLYHYPFTLYY